MQTLVIYPGRFHPFHRGHFASYRWLTDRFGADSVFVATSDKQDPETSPFSFADKQFMMNKMGIPPSHVVKVRNPYQAQEITQNFDPDNTVLIFAISDKDAERISFKPKRDGSPSYLQPYPQDDKKLLPMSQHGYAILTPRANFRVQGKDADSASQIRALYAKANDAGRDNIIADLYGDVDGNLRKIFDQRLAPKSESNEFVYEDQDYVEENKDACYHKVRSRYKVWPSAYASGALVQCRKKGAKNWGNKTTEQMLETIMRMREMIETRKRELRSNKKIVETAQRDKLAQQHQEIRRQAGLPRPSYYRELKATFDLPDSERQAAVTALKKKYKIKESGPFSYGAKKPRKGSVADLAAKKRQEQERGKQPAEPRDQMVGVAKVFKEFAPGDGNDRNITWEQLVNYMRRTLDSFGFGFEGSQNFAEYSRGNDALHLEYDPSDPGWFGWAIGRYAGNFNVDYSGTDPLTIDSAENVLEYVNNVFGYQQGDTQDGVAEDNDIRTIRGPHGRLDVDRTKKGVTRVSRRGFRTDEPDREKQAVRGRPMGSVGYTPGVGVPQRSSFSDIHSEYMARRKRPHFDYDDDEFMESRTPQGNSAVFKAMSQVNQKK